MSLHPIFDELFRAMFGQTTTDPRDADPSREGIFRDHNCWKCQDGAKPCVEGRPNLCGYPRARND